MKIPFLPKRNSSNPKPAKVSKKQKQKVLNGLEQSRQRRQEYTRRLRVRY